MTDEQRKQKFITEYNQLAQRYGFVVDAVCVRMAQRWEIEPKVIPLPGWQSPLLDDETETQDATEEESV
jgi:hypothetical protein